MSLRDDLLRLAHEHQDLAEAIEELLKPVNDSVGRMCWKGPHRDRVRTELGTMTRNARVVAESLRGRAKLIRDAAFNIPDNGRDALLALGGPVGRSMINQAPAEDPLVLLRALQQQLTPMGPAVAEVFARHGVR
ncbi:hypothetical protein Mth01_51820 [Sphaerimonospora thailandensis]|uniref:Uncharacterized protein n=2 Tax=Sphaerimonospora thailandensis TaxID=795644 RepID=A0A8J3RDR2_9ACTN|nr:hypothetical protein Mth01_51820 [Sphaerimonospora thailandensis]